MVVNQQLEIEYLEECPCCQQKGFNHFIKSNGWQIVRCKNCKLLFVNPRPSEASIKKLFVDEYIETDERVNEDFTSWRQGCLTRESARLKSFYPQGGRLLDIGTASGAFLGKFSDCNNWQAEGLEPSRFAAKLAADRYKTVVYHGFLCEQGFPDESYDIVTSLDTFYFHSNPRTDLAEVYRILKPKGLLAIEIPGLRFRLLKNTGFLSRIIYKVPARLNAGVHLFYYSRQTLNQMVEQFGFKEVAVYPEQSPVYGSWYTRIGNWFYFQVTALLYKISFGYFNIVPKEFIIYRKEG